MNLTSFSSSGCLRRASVAAVLTAVGMATLAATPAAASTIDGIQHEATIDTHKGWDGASSVIPFGCPDTTAYGETITVPEGLQEINKFTFYMSDGGVEGSMRVRGEIYAWDGAKATGSAVGQTKAQTIDFSDTAYHPVRFRFQDAMVTPGSQYVIFATIDKNYEKCSDYTVAWGATDDGAYPGGTFVFQNNSGDESLWTTTPWNPAGIDAALKAYLG